MNNRNYDINNIFAKIINKEAKADIVYENKFVLCFKDIFPKAPVHILILPKNDYIDIYDFSKNATEQEKNAIFLAFKELIEKYELDKKGNRIITNSGSNGRQEIAHLHFHLLGGKDIGSMLNNSS